VIAGRRYTSAEALDRFVAATDAAAKAKPVSTHTPRQRARVIRAAEEEVGLSYSTDGS
jgi:hypothetical protein